MKELKDIAWNVSEKEYRKDIAISYSTLSTYAKEGFKGVYAILSGRKLDTGSLRHGSMVDTLLTDADNFDDLYKVMNYQKPTDMMRSIADAVWDKYKESSLDKVPKKSLLDIINSKGFGGESWKSDTKINKVIDGGGEYYSLLSYVGDKQLAHPDDYHLAVKCVNELRSNPYTSWIFKESDTIKVYYQLKFKMTFQGWAVDDEQQKLLTNEWKNKPDAKSDKLNDNIRCMFDIIVVDYANKRIYPIDLKTTSMPEEDFHLAIQDWYYELQACKYSFILRSICKADDYFKDFEVNSFCFLPINKFSLNPQIYRYLKSTSNLQTKFVDYKGRLHKPWYSYLEDVRWHIKEWEWRYSREIVQNRGINNVIF